MSNYASAVLATGQAKVTAKNQIPEQRHKTPTVFELALKNQEYSIPNAQELRKSPLRPVDINYFTSVTPGSATTKAYNHSGTYGDSGKVNLVYVSHVETFGIPKKIAANSIFEYQNIFDNLYEQKWKNLRTRHDNSALSFLHANRVQLLGAVMNPRLASAAPGTWNATNFALEIASGNANLFIQKVKTAMAASLYSGELDIVSDLQLAAAFDYASQQGAGNSANTAFQFAGTNIAVTQDQIDSAYAKGAVYALPKGMLSGLNWNEQLNRIGLNDDQGGAIGVLGTIADPFGSGAVADISQYTQRADTSANTYGGSTQDFVDQWEITMTVGYALPPLSLAGDSVVMEIAQV